MHSPTIPTVVVGCGSPYATSTPPSRSAPTRRLARMPPAMTTSFFGVLSR